MVARDDNGVLVPDPVGFPDGIEPLASYVHAQGFKFGIYTDRGNKTCAGRPASGGHEAIDAKTFASWGVDYVKQDSCNASQWIPTEVEEYSRMRDALNATGRPIYFSLCGWEFWYAFTGKEVGNSWRISGDCNGWYSIFIAIRVNQLLYPFSGPGGWNDPDMLVGSSPAAAVYNTPDQSRTQFTLWSMMAAPLLIGSNILNMSAWDYETYTNAEVIAVDQDPLGAQGTTIFDNCPLVPLVDLQEQAALLRGSNRRPEGTPSPLQDSPVPACQQIWRRDLADGSVAVAMVNFDVFAVNVTCDATCFTKIGFTSAAVRDLWAHTDLGVMSSYSVNLAGGGHSVALKFTKAA